MDVLFMSNSGESLPIVYRLRREGVDAGIYLHNPQYRSNYDGLLKKLTARDLPKVVRKTPVIIFDITRPNEKTKEDATLLKLFGLKENLPSVFGPLADKLKKDSKVIGSSALTEELELDRKKGMDLARKVGFTLPEAHEFKSLAEGAKFLKDRTDLWVLKPHNNQDLDLTYVEKFRGELYLKLTTEYRSRLDCDYTLQKKIDGAEVSTEVWIGPEGPVHFNHTIEDKRLMSGNLGLSIGSQSNTVWIETKGLLVNLLTKAAAQLKGYIGPCDANCIIKDGVPYFLEWSPRFGYDAIYCLLTLLKGSLGDFFLKDFKVDFHDGYAASQRVSIPPYPYDNPILRKTLAEGRIIQNEPTRWFWAQDVKQNGDKLVCAGADGILGIVTGRGTSLAEAWGRVHHNLGKLKVTTYLQYRTDGLKEAEKRIKGLKVA